MIVKSYHMMVPESESTLLKYCSFNYSDDHIIQIVNWAVIYLNSNNVYEWHGQPIIPGRLIFFGVFFNLFNN